MPILLILIINLTSEAFQAFIVWLFFHWRWPIQSKGWWNSTLPDLPLVRLNIELYNDCKALGNEFRRSSSRAASTRQHPEGLQDSWMQIRACCDCRGLQDELREDPELFFGGKSFRSHRPSCLGNEDVGEGKLSPPTQREQAVPFRAGWWRAGRPGRWNLDPRDSGELRSPVEERRCERKASIWKFGISWRRKYFGSEKFIVLFAS